MAPPIWTRPSVSLSHQEASINLLSFSIRGQTDWKPQSQKTIQSDQMDHCCLVASVVSDSVQPHRQQPTRLPRPWDSPGKNTGVGCHFLLQCMKVKSESEFAQSCLTLCNSMNCSLPGSSTHGIFQEYWSGVPLAGHNMEGKCRNG